LDDQLEADAPKRFGGMLRIFQPAPSAAVTLTDPAEVTKKYRYWQGRVLLASIIGYATFYFVRKNLSIAMPAMEHNLGIGKANLGLFLTLHGLLYGVSKFANGFLADPPSRVIVGRDRAFRRRRECESGSSESYESPGLMI